MNPMENLDQKKEKARSTKRQVNGTVTRAVHERHIERKENGR